ncbi:copper-binding protein [Oxalobacteraceae bacterium OM1]|nr:copper-binding protein [Oxalobacteraceae bacterium OM1]
MAAGRVHVVNIEAMQFQPSTLDVQAGDTVVWKNKDPFPHTATAVDRSFDSGSLAPGAQWKMVVKKPGSVAYFCTLHETMRATLDVKPR